MTGSDWLLALHVLAAFALVSGVVATVALQATAGRRERASDVVKLLRLAEITSRVLIAGVVGTLVFGVWLALDLDAYKITDGWVLAAIILWVIGGAIGSRGDARERATRLEVEREAEGDDGVTPALAARLRDPQTLALHWTGAAIYAAILVLMIWKPGA